MHSWKIASNKVVDVNELQELVQVVFVGVLVYSRARASALGNLRSVLSGDLLIHDCRSGCLLFLARYLLLLRPLIHYQLLPVFFNDFKVRRISCALSEPSTREVDNVVLVFSVVAFLA